MTIKSFRALAIATLPGLILTQPVASARSQETVTAPPPSVDIAGRLVTGYPGIVTRIDGNDVVFSDGTLLPLDDGKGEKPFETWLAEPDIEDMVRLPYPTGAPASPPAKNFDPGRARNHAFFAKVYGDCKTGSVKDQLVNVIWLPKKLGKTIKVTRVNAVAEKLRAVSDELDQLPARFNEYLFPIGGTYACRVVAGTQSPSAHGYGIAIDIALKNANYWRWDKRRPDGTITYKNAIPMEIVAVFEKHGFIWGGRWHHHDTMHFEYRPELLPVRDLPALPK